MDFFQLIIETLLGSVQSIVVTVLATLAITIIFKTSNTTNFAQGLISAVGGYVTLQLSHSLGIPIYFGIFIAVICGMGLGVFIDVVIFRRGNNVNAIGKQIITMGIISLLVGLIPFVFSVASLESVPMIPFVALSKKIKLFGEVYIQTNTVICFLIALVIVSLVFIALNYTKWGLGVRATASNEKTAAMMGVNTKVITAFSWALAGGIGAVAGTMYAGMVTLSSAFFFTTIAVNAFLAGILGGFKTFHGPIIGAILIPLISSVVGIITNIVFPSLSVWREVFVYAIILILVLIKPEGLFGKKVAKKV